MPREIDDVAPGTMLERALQRRILAAHALADIASAVEAGAGAVGAALAAGHKVVLFGNGGSAALAQHIAAEFVGRFDRDRRALPALALTADTSALTAIGNDYSFREVFSRQLEALGARGDAAFAISTSGRSPNVLAAVETARTAGMSTIGLTGGDGGPLAAVVDIAVVVPTSSTAVIQEVHLAIAHMIVELVEDELGEL